MKKRTIAILILVYLILFNSSQVFTQTPNTEKKSMVRIGLGNSFSGYREETIVDTNRYLNTFIVTINGNIEKGRFLHSYNIGFFRGINKAIFAYPVYQYELQPDNYGQLYKYYQAEDKLSRLFLEYSLDYRLWGNNVFPGYAGLAFRGDIYLIETLINPVYINFTGIGSLDLHVSQKWIINSKNTLAFSLSFPVFGYAIRPHYIGFSAWPFETDIVSLHNYWAGFGNLKYQYAFTERISLYADIGIELSRIDFPRPRKDAGLQLILGIGYTY